jgi:hypothetical protein
MLALSKEAQNDSQNECKHEAVQVCVALWSLLLPFPHSLLLK